MMRDERDRKTISFPPEDHDLVVYLDSCDNASWEVRQALRQYIEGKDRVEALCELMIQQHQRMAETLERLEHNGVAVPRSNPHHSEGISAEHEEMAAKLRDLGKV